MKQEPESLFVKEKYQRKIWKEKVILKLIFFNTNKYDRERNLDAAGT